MEDQVGLLFDGDRRGRDGMVVGFTYGTSAHNH
jgi:hypothetical protein